MHTALLLKALQKISIFPWERNMSFLPVHQSWLLLDMILLDMMKNRAFEAAVHLILINGQISRTPKAPVTRQCL